MCSLIPFPESRFERSPSGSLPSCTTFLCPLKGDPEVGWSKFSAVADATPRDRPFFIGDVKGDAWALLAPLLRSPLLSIILCYCQTPPTTTTTATERANQVTSTEDSGSVLPRSKDPDLGPAPLLASMAFQSRSVASNTKASSSSSSRLAAPSRCLMFVPPPHSRTPSCQLMAHCLGGSFVFRIQRFPQCRSRVAPKISDAIPLNCGNRKRSPWAPQPKEKK